jgi:hypothetical protein
MATESGQRVDRDERRAVLAGLAALAAVTGGLLAPVRACAQPGPSLLAAARRLASGPHVLMIRHAETEPGVGDPPGYRLDDCATQRNLDRKSVV